MHTKRSFRGFRSGKHTYPGAVMKMLRDILQSQRMTLASGSYCLYYRRFFPLISLSLLNF